MYARDENDQSANRVSIWSVSEEDLRLYSVIFPFLWLIFTAYHAFFGIDWQTDGWIGGIDKFLLDTGILGVSAAVIGMILLVARRVVMVLFDWPSKRERAVRRAYEAGKQAAREEQEAQRERREKAITPDTETFEVQVIASDNSVHGQRRFDNLADAKSWVERQHAEESDTVQVVHFMKFEELMVVRDVFRFERGNWYQRLVE